MRRMLAAVLALALLCGCSAAQTENTAPKLPVGDPFPEFTAQGLNGGEFGSNMFKSNTLTALLLWRPQSAACTAQLADLNRLRESFSERGLAVAAMLTDSSADAVELARAQTIGYEEAGFIQLIAPQTPDLTPLMTARRLPCIFFIDRDGNLLGDSLAGQRYYEELEELATFYLDSLQPPDRQEDGQTPT